MGELVLALAPVQNLNLNLGTAEEPLRNFVPCVMIKVDLQGMEMIEIWTLLSC